MNYGKDKILATTIPEVDEALQMYQRGKINEKKRAFSKKKISTPHLSQFK